MLAAILLNLPDYQKKAGGSRRRAVLIQEPQSRGKRIANAVSEILELAQSPKVLGIKKRIKQAAKAVEAYNEAPQVGIREVADTHAMLEALEFDLERMTSQSKIDEAKRNQLLLVLDQIDIILSFVQDDEETILVLLLSEA